ncbi:MAG: Rrf2 family transcriptional regulator [Lachnospiraceae bacterium]
MKLTKGFEQSACIITLLATQQQSTPVTSHAINRRLHGSPTYLRKLIRKLVVSGLVVSVSGNNGGFALSRPPEQITLCDIVEAVEGRIETYPASGLINQVFKEMKTGAEQIIKKVFADADSMWRNVLLSKNVLSLIQETIGKKELPQIDWNEFSDEKPHLFSKF